MELSLKNLEFQWVEKTEKLTEKNNQNLVENLKNLKSKYDSEIVELNKRINEDKLKYESDLKKLNLNSEESSEQAKNEYLLKLQEMEAEKGICLYICICMHFCLCLYMYVFIYK
jgi:triphosphoribosyl-dephospho-CoA synthetase